MNVAGDGLATYHPGHRGAHEAAQALRHNVHEAHGALHEPTDPSANGQGGVEVGTRDVASHVHDGNQGVACKWVQFSTGWGLGVEEGNQGEAGGIFSAGAGGRWKWGRWRGLGAPTARVTSPPLYAPPLPSTALTVKKNVQMNSVKYLARFQSRENTRMYFGMSLENS